MSEITDEDFRRFVVENKERILDILQENLPSEEAVDRAFEPVDRMKEKMSEKKEAVSGVARDVYLAVTSPEVHRHFVKMGMEFFMGLNELADRLPVPDGVRRFKEDMDRSESEIRKEMCRNNPDCRMRQRDPEPAGLEKIELD